MSLLALIPALLVLTVIAFIAGALVTIEVLTRLDCGGTYPPDDDRPPDTRPPLPTTGDRFLYDWAQENAAHDEQPFTAGAETDVVQALRGVR